MDHHRLSSAAPRRDKAPSAHRTTAKPLLASLGAAAVISLALASCDTTQRIVPGRPLLVSAALIASGPIIGWIEALLMKQIPAAAGFLIVVSGIAVAPLACWLRSRDPAALVVGVLGWVLAGYVFGVAIWV